MIHLAGNRMAVYIFLMASAKVSFLIAALRCLTIV